MVLRLLRHITGQKQNYQGRTSRNAGWIGRKRQETEGVWKWVTGPLIELYFGMVLVLLQTFSLWNTNDNQSGNEDYAHITAPELANQGPGMIYQNTETLIK
jgi:hypothetical protein